MTGPAWAAGSRCDRVRCGGAKGDCRKVATLRRRAQCVELAAQGTALKAHQADAVDHLREMEVQPLDGLQAPVWERALLLATLATDPKPNVRAGAASNPNTPPELLATLATDRSHLVRVCIASLDELADQ